jgi:hypothetical protein
LSDVSNGLVADGLSTLDFELNAGEEVPYRGS